MESVSGVCWVVAGSLSSVEVFAYDVFVDPACEEGGGFGCNLSVYGLFECMCECSGAFFDDVDLW